MSAVPQPPGPSVLQFDRAEFVSPAGASCARCKAPLTVGYYTVGRDVLCAACAAHAVEVMRGGSGVGRGLRAIVLGVLASGLGAGIYFAVAEITGVEIGLVAIVVGFLVGIAVRIGSRGRGGGFYQLLAVFLTYAAIGASYFATGMVEASRHRHVAAFAPADALDVILLGKVILELPVLSSMQSPLGFVIIGVALLQAWRLNRGGAFAIAGPFAVGMSPPAGSAAPPTVPPTFPEGGPHG